MRLERAAGLRGAQDEDVVANDGDAEPEHRRQREVRVERAEQESERGGAPSSSADRALERLGFA
ncbi:MAG: hypothetical protein AUH85_06185 [Chloroflexi bacterium 13_1_40CM_4_68_4]|nr:MAG: hypothetical protein AUH85_06185 [Chloroflexi bacterium 13_1_40CM_4_68_4]